MRRRAGPGWRGASGGWRRRGARCGHGIRFGRGKVSAGVGVESRSGSRLCNASTIDIPTPGASLGWRVGQQGVMVSVSHGARPFLRQLGHVSGPVIAGAAPRGPNTGALARVGKILLPSRLGSRYNSAVRSCQSLNRYRKAGPPPLAWTAAGQVGAPSVAGMHPPAPRSPSTI